MSAVQHTPGPWPLEPTGDYKRWIVGKGLIEGPRGYDLAEVYSDDCDPVEAEANARLIAAAPELFEAVRLFLAYDAGDMDDGAAMMIAYAEARSAAIAANAKASGEVA